MGRELDKPAGGIRQPAAVTGEAVFHWDMGRDAWHWAEGAREVLQLAPGVDIGSHRAMLLMMDAVQAEARTDAIRQAVERGQREYVISYRFLPGGRGEERGFMVVERGTWVPDAQGNPAHVFGTIRRLDCTGESSCAIPGMPEMDPASGLYCRSYFFRRLERFLQEEAPRQQHAAVLLVSLRNYSLIFDAYGFEAADATYNEVARRLNAVLRAGDIIARYGDNRIAMLIHDCAEDDLEPAMRRFIQTPMSRPVHTDPAPVWPMLAVGAVLLPQQARGLTEAITAAEEALSEAEAGPAGGVAIYSVKARKVSQRALKARFANEIFDMLRQRRFTLAFQPIITTDGAVMCHEALLRMFDEQGKPVPAAHLVPVAEELGLIRQIDMEVLELALQALRDNPQGCLAINISAITVLAAEEFLQRLEEDAALVDGRLIVEITESAALGDAEQVNAVIDRLHALGCRVALDDFGAGYTSFRNLRDFRFDIVKLDGAFCENLSSNAQNQHFVRSLIELARNIDIQIIAEWVEAEEDAALLREWGVDAMQGYLFGSPGTEGAWRAPMLCAPEEQTLVFDSRKAAEKADAEADDEHAAAAPAESAAEETARKRSVMEGASVAEAAMQPVATEATAAASAPAVAADTADGQQVRADGAAPAEHRTVARAEMANAPETGSPDETDGPKAQDTVDGVSAPQAVDAASPSVPAPAPSSAAARQRESAKSTDARALMRDVEADLKRLRELLQDMRRQRGDAHAAADARRDGAPSREAARA